MSHIIHFASANGFASGTYNTLFNHLDNELFKVISKPLLAHDSNFPILKEWEGGKNEIIDFIEKNAKEKVLGIGHSYGGVSTFLAAVERPDLFKGIILLDPVLLIGKFSWLVKLYRFFGYGDEISPAKYSKNRRDTWESKELAYKSLRNKGLYKNFEESCFQDFINYTTEEIEGVCKLKFTVEKEVEIYRTAPVNLDRFKGKCKVPIALLVGDKTDVTVDYFANRFIKQHKITQYHKVKGGHMFPLENTKATAQKIIEVIASWV
jgi:pimeloyl-ACP methyl ester carboxylesterase